MGVFVENQFTYNKHINPVNTPFLVSCMGVNSRSGIFL